jgi:hypothetical protein
MSSFIVCTYHHHHQVLLLLVGHRVSMKSFQVTRSPAIPLTSFHDLLVPLISSSIVLPHVLLGLPLFLYPWRFQSNAVFSIASASLYNVCPIQFHFLLLIWFSIDSCWVMPHYRRRLRVASGATAPVPALEGAPRFRPKVVLMSLSSYILR